mgnify:CR=1 FL=1
MKPLRIRSEFLTGSVNFFSGRRMGHIEFLIFQTYHAVWYFVYSNHTEKEEKREEIGQFPFGIRI